MDRTPLHGSTGSPWTANDAQSSVIALVHKKHAMWAPAGGPRHACTKTSCDLSCLAADVREWQWLTSVGCTVQVHASVCACMCMLFLIFLVQRLTGLLGFSQNTHTLHVAMDSLRASVMDIPSARSLSPERPPRRNSGRNCYLIYTSFHQPESIMESFYHNRTSP